METFALDNTLSQLRAALERDDLSGATEIIQALRPPDQAELFAELDNAEQVTLLPELSPAESADILEELADDEAAAPQKGSNDADHARADIFQPLAGKCGCKPEEYNGDREYPHHGA